MSSWKYENWRECCSSEGLILLERESMQTVYSRTSFYVFLLCAQIKCSSSNCNRLQPILICSSSHLAPLIMICCTQIWLQEYQPNVKFPSPVIRCLTFLVHSPNILLKYSQATDYFAVIFVDFKLLVLTLQRAIFFLFHPANI